MSAFRYRLSFEEMSIGGWPGLPSFEEMWRPLVCRLPQRGPNGNSARFPALLRIP